jgi:hypothetical protein
VRCLKPLRSLTLTHQMILLKSWLEKKIISQSTNQTANLLNLEAHRLRKVEKAYILVGGQRLGKKLGVGRLQDLRLTEVTWTWTN